MTENHLIQKSKKIFPNKSHNKSPKKSLGQNFLTNKIIARNVVRAGEVREGEAVVEAGPGRGILTEMILETGARVIAIEKDESLIPALREKFAPEIQCGKLVVVSGDILDFQPENFGLENSGYAFISNIPYYITGAIIRHFLELAHQPESMAIMIQKEVAERILARGGKESVLSLGVKAYGAPKIIQTVKAGNFSPAPKVDSAILAIENISRKNFRSISEQTFFTLVKTGFSQKRKLLSSNVGKNFSEKMFSACGIPPKSRAEDLALSQWLCLAKEERAGYK